MTHDVTLVDYWDHNNTYCHYVIIIQGGIGEAQCTPAVSMLYIIIIIMVYILLPFHVLLKWPSPCNMLSCLPRATC